MKHARGRAKERRFLVEGRRSIAAAVESRAALEIFVDERAVTAGDRELLESVRAAGLTPTALSAADLASISDTVTPQAILATAPIPTAGLADTLARARGLVLVLDGVRDPGNAGAILRAASAYAVHTAVLLAGTVDAWNPKVVRGAMGAHFQIALATAAAPEDVFSALVGRGYEPWIAVAHGGESPPERAASSEIALVIGGEASGPGATALGQPARHVTVATPGCAESLNVAVATGILLDRISRPSAS